ncbi:MAG TPA: protein translocase subunit SecD [Candidatus Dormibacteraeota bacterium]
MSWPVRIIVIGLLLLSLLADGSGYVYRFVNHYPMTGNVPGLPPNLGGLPVYLHKGLDLSGGTDLQLQLSNFPAGQDRATVQQTTINVIQKRVNALGVSEPVVQAAGGGNHDRIDVQLAGVSSAQAQQVIGKTAQLVITRWVKDASITNGPIPGYKPQITEMRSEMLTSASAGLDPQTSTSWVVNFQFNSTGANIFSQLSTSAYNACTTGDCPERHITDWLDLTQSDIDNWNTVANSVYRPYDQGGKLLSDPTIQNPITGGQGFIQGSFSQQSAKDLATLLSSGSLPVKLDVIQSTDVGASLGADSIKASLAAAILGLMIVVIFMIAFYRLPGVLASLALLFYAGVVLAVFKAFAFTLTLAGTAGFILSVGMAVDANVLIFERFKEEMRAGRTIGAAVDAAVRRAWPAIRDSNTATLITSIILAFATTGSVHGFAITLAIGVAISLISSIIVTHNLLAIVLNFGWSRTTGLLGVARGRA